MNPLQLVYQKPGQKPGASRDGTFWNPPYDASPAICRMRPFKRLRPMAHYLCKLNDKMHAQGWPETDELHQLARAAHDALHGLSIHTHYLACGKVRRPSKRKE